MSGRFLLDTNIVIALFANETPVKDYLARADEVFASSIAIGELCFGARKSGRASENLARIDEFAANSVVLGCDTDTARRYGEIKNALRLKGHPLPENDIGWQRSRSSMV
jgi:tRNA(fMet)-specific endonuclease VapC